MAAIWVMRKFIFSVFDIITGSISEPNMVFDVLDGSDTKLIWIG
jgi:hypothetical protein